MSADTGVLTYLLNAFLSVFSAGFGGVLPDARRFLFLIAGIELTVIALWWALRGENFIIVLIQKLMMIGVFAFFVLNWPTLISAVINGFVSVGLNAGGGAGFPSMTNPSAIVDLGFNMIAPIDAKVASLSWYQLADVSLYGLAEILSLLAFFILAIQVAVTYLEFYIVAVLALVLVPFGVNRYTAFLSEKAFGAIIGFGVKLMVLAFIMSAAAPVMATITVPANPGLREAWSVFLAAGFVAFLAFHAPGVAAGMMSGGPSLTAGAVARTAAGAAIAGGGLAGAAAGAARTAAAGGASAVQAATRGAGTVHAGGQMGAATAAMAGRGRLGQAAGAVQGAATAVAGATRNAAMAPVRDATAGLRRSFEAGEVTGWRGLGLKPAAPAEPANSLRDSAATARRHGAVDQMVRASHVIPPEAHPQGGGMSPNLRG